MRTGLLLWVVLAACSGDDDGRPAEDAAVSDASVPDAAGPGSDAGADADAAVDAAVEPPDGGDADAAVDPGDDSDVVFAQDVLHHVELEIDPDLFSQLDEDHQTRVPAVVTYDGERLEDVGIRERCGIGSCSGIGDKTGFSIKFDELVPDQELHDLDRLTLANEIQDTSYSNRFLANELERRAGIPYARLAWADVTLNGDPYGLFVVLEATDRRYLRRWFGEGQDGGNLYEGPCCGDFVADPYLPELKDEDEGRTRDDLIDLAAFIADEPDATFPGAVADRIEWPGYLASYAIVALVDHWDSYEYNGNNYYIYHRPSDDRFVFWLHGEDQLFGDCSWPIDWYGTGRLGQRVQELPELRDAFHAEIDRQLDEVWLVDELSDALEDAVEVYGDAARADPRHPLDEGRLDAVRSCLFERPAIVRLQRRAVCGNGVVDEGEACDDGGIEAGDGCSPTCRSECGNGRVDGGEQCDDGNAWEGDGCSPDCGLEPGCGDLLVQPELGEECDDGRNGDGQDGCRDDCRSPRCGDGVLDPGEACDDAANLDLDGCSALCADEDGVATCGNGLWEAGEECDDGGVAPGDACDPDCLRPCTGGDTNLVWAANGHCYMIFWSAFGWPTAADECTARAGHLVTVTTEAENRLLRDLGVGWIGLSDRDDEGTFAWVTGEPYDWNAFREGEPNDWGGEDCAVLDSASWNDLPCDSPVSFFCEIE